MERTLSLLGNVAAIVGVLVCVASGLARVAGAFYVGGFTATTLFQGGTGLLVAACFAKLYVLEARAR